MACLYYIPAAVTPSMCPPDAATAEPTTWATNAGVQVTSGSSNPSSFPVSASLTSSPYDIIESDRNRQSSDVIKATRAEMTSQMPTGSTGISSRLRMCNCRCVAVTTNTSTRGRSVQNAEFRNKLTEKQRELTVQVSSLSSSMRRRVSAPDPRPTSQTAGLFSVILLVLLTVGVVVSDLTQLIGCLQRLNKRDQEDGEAAV